MEERVEAIAQLEQAIKEDTRRLNDLLALLQHCEVLITNNNCIHNILSSL